MIDYIYMYENNEKVDKINKHTKDMNEHTNKINEQTYKQTSK